MKETSQMLKATSGVIDSTFITIFATMGRFAKRLIENGGMYSIALIIPLEIARLAAYWLNGNADKISLNTAYYLAKTLTAIAGTVLVLTGAITLGFTLIIATGYAVSLRALWKMIRSAKDGHENKVRNNLCKLMIGSLIAGGFTLMTFVPALGIVAWGLVMAGEGFALLSTLSAQTPRLLVQLIAPPEPLTLRADEKTPAASSQFTPQYTEQQASAWRMPTSCKQRVFGETLTF